MHVYVCTCTHVPMYENVSSHYSKLMLVVIVKYLNELTIILR